MHIWFLVMLLKIDIFNKIYFINISVHYVGVTVGESNCRGWLTISKDISKITVCVMYEILSDS